MTLAEKNIRELTKIVFSEKYEYIDEPKKYRGKSRKLWTFDALVRNAESLYGIFIRDWKREISITQLRQLHKACLDVPEIDGGIMICNIVSEFSSDYSKQFGLQLLSKGKLISKIRNNRFSSYSL